MRNLSRLEKRTCLSSTCYRPSMVSNAFPDQSFSPCHHREIICSYIRTPTAPAVPRRYSFYAGCPSLPSTVGFSRTPFSDCSDSAPKSDTPTIAEIRRRAREREREGERDENARRPRFRDARAFGTQGCGEHPSRSNFAPFETFAQQTPNGNNIKFTTSHGCSQEFFEEGPHRKTLI